MWQSVCLKIFGGLNLKITPQLVKMISLTLFASICVGYLYGDMYNNFSAGMIISLSSFVLMSMYVIHMYYYGNNKFL